MNKDLERVIEVPEGITVEIAGNNVTVKGNGNEIKKEMNFYKIDSKVESGSVTLSSKGATRRQAKMMGTIAAHIKNMIKGASEEFEYTLEVCNVHFPMNVKADNDKVVIKSFLGETTERHSKILPGVKVDVKGSTITVTSNDIEAAGQTAANLEKATRLKGRDRRIFQDGIFITHKPGRVI